MLKMNVSFFLSVFFLGLLSAGQISCEISADTSIGHVFEEHLRPILEEHFTDADIDAIEDVYSEYSAFAGFSLKSIYNMFGSANMNSTQCEQCQKLVKLAKILFQTPESAIGMIQNAGLCKDGPKLSARMCNGLLERLAGPLIWALQNTDLSPEEKCVQLTSSSCLKHLNVSRSETKVFWELELPPVRATPFKPILDETSDKKMNILHLTDVHLDLWYEAGTDASCNEALCCRSNSIDMLNKSYSAGHWASDKGACDIPLSFVIDSLKQIASRHEFDAIFWTGDNVPHDVWNTTQQINLRHINTMSGVVNVAFDGIPLFPALGNHETHPINLYIPSELHAKSGQNMSWLFEPIVNEYWAKWINTPEAKKTFLKGGYYAKNISEGWKVIVLNTNMPQKANFWQMASYVDPDGQLAWLIQELDKAEATGQYVSILGHIPPGYSIYDAWFHNYVRIVDRYSHIINAGYFGHTHKDEIKLIYNEKQEPININYISGSLTTYSFLNPNYVVYETDARGFVQDSTVYMTNVANNEKALHKHPESKPVWYKEYSPKDSYKMDDMSPRSWHKYLSSASKSLDIAYLYTGHFHRFSPLYTKHHPFSEKKILQLIKHAQPCSPFHETCVLPEADDDENDDDDDGGGFD